MPHRATYFFPRQFPERAFDESSKQLLDHEKKKIVKSIKHDTSFSVEKDSLKNSFPSPTKDNNDDDVVLSSGKHSAVSDLFANAGDKFRTKHKPIAAFCDWLIDKKVNHHSGHHRHHRDRECDVLLPAEKEDAVDRSLDRQVSLPRLSSGSSYAGSLFSGTTTLDCNFSSDIKEETSSCRTLTTIPAPTSHKDEEEEKHSTEKFANKSKESYILQLTLAKRLNSLAGLVTEPVLTSGTETWDAESVSYRLWVQNSSHC